MNASRIGMILLCLLLLPVQAFAVCSKNQPGWLWNYNGEMGGKYRIRMTLVFSGEEVSGVYFYASSLKDIPLRGRMLDATHVLLEELDAAGNAVASFRAEFPEKDPESAFGDRQGPTHRFPSICRWRAAHRVPSSTATPPSACVTRNRCTATRRPSGWR